MNDVPHNETAQGVPQHPAPADPLGFGAPDALASGPERPARLPRVRRIVAVVLPVVLVLGGAGGAGFYVKSTVDKADTTVTTKHWGKEGKPGEDPAGDAHRGRHDTELSKLLLPVPEGYHLGPDLDENGNDSSLSGKQATAQLKATGRGLTGKQRREFNQRMEKFGVQGVAGRSYVDEQSGFILETTVIKAKDRKALRDLQSFMTSLTRNVPGAKNGPKIEGHSKAKCTLMPAEKGVEMDDMFCSAQVADAFVSVYVYGPKPMNKADVARFLKKQLDHIKSPGEYV
ncbi:hypothetical protein H9Y04_29370 [Streptomyces sp. TRM66268-LWL]|uniref:Secreted protein n=1 Tax=Streptomyces polyasparticus TaxID=2767826 RepID=A0ABR7SPN1_9ACTN|nr:hypothetical protein [Streptomyces polyasparticus]MBC9716650.1 hypothetical protein [Streptomyces polyasparticus]